MKITSLVTVVAATAYDAATIGTLKSTVMETIQILILSTSLILWIHLIFVLMDVFATPLRYVEWNPVRPMETEEISP